VSPTGRNLLSTGPVDNGLFRSVLAAYGFPQLTCRSVAHAYVSVHVTTVPNAYSIGLRRVSDGLGGSVQRM
jgi:hypothetical protein